MNRPARGAAWLLSAGALALVVQVTGCTKPTPKPSAESEDRARLEPALHEDERAARAMGEADQAQRKGDIIGALDALDTRVKPAIEAGLKLQKDADVRSDWGRRQRTALGVLLEDRRGQIEPYREAVLSNDQDKLVGALEAQVRLDKRALAIVTDFQAVH